MPWNLTVNIPKKVKKASSYIVQFPVLRTIQSALHLTSLTDLFTQTPSRLLWKAFSYMLHLMREGCSYTYPPLSMYTHVYSWVNWINVEWKNLPNVLTPQHTIRTRVLVESRVRSSTPEQLRSDNCIRWFLAPFSGWRYITNTLAVVAMWLRRHGPHPDHRVTRGDDVNMSMFICSNSAVYFLTHPDTVYLCTRLQLIRRLSAAGIRVLGVGLTV